MPAPQRETRFPELKPLRERLFSIHQRTPHDSDGVEVCLIHLVEALEEAAYQVEARKYYDEENDSTQDIANLSRLGGHLQTVAQALQGALQERNAYYRW